MYLHTFEFVLLTFTFTNIHFQMCSCQLNTCSPNANGAAPVLGNCQAFVYCDNGVQIGNEVTCNPINGNAAFYDFFLQECVSDYNPHRCFIGSSIQCLSFSDANFQTYIPDPVFCGDVQSCDGSSVIPTPTSCPGNLFFDYVQGACKSDPVRCYPGSIKGHRPIVPTTQTSTPIPTTTFMSTTRDPSTRCIPGRTSFIEHETDCRKFFRCDFDGNPFPMECRDGFLFDILEKTCLDETVALCYSTATTPTPVVIPTTPTTTTSTTTARPPVDCPATGIFNATHPRNCCYYYSCLSGELSIERCWNGELFDSSDLICKSRTRARCTPGSVPCKTSIVSSYTTTWMIILFSLMKLVVDRCFM